MQKFIVKSSDSYNEKNYEIVSGSIISDGQWLIYKYNSKLGQCELKISEDRVIISRRGEVSTDIEVNLNNKTKFLYKTYNFEKQLFVMGESIKIDEAKGLLEISYRLYDGEEELNRVNISIKKY